MRTRRFVAGLAGLAATAGLAASAAPAAAAARDCPPKRMCLFFNSNFAGARADFARMDGGLADELFNDGPRNRAGFGVQVNNNAASAVNHSGDYITLYDGPFCNIRPADRRRNALVLRAGEQTNLGSYLKNKVSSVSVGPNQGRCVNINSSRF